MVILKQANEKSCSFCPAAEVMLEVMPEVMSAETALIKWSEVFFIIVYYNFNWIWQWHERNLQKQPLCATSGVCSWPTALWSLQIVCCVLPQEISRNFKGIWDSATLKRFYSPFLQSQFYIKKKKTKLWLIIRRYFIQLTISLHNV